MHDQDVAEIKSDLIATYESLKRVFDVLERLRQQPYKRGPGRHGMSKVTDGPKTRLSDLRGQVITLKDELRELGVAEEDIPKDPYGVASWPHQRSLDEK